VGTLAPADFDRVESRVMPILEHFVDRTPGSFVEEKKYSVVWNYRTAEPELGGGWPTN
jgi:trehalose 6-phosphate synthase/phosphatase